MVFLILPLLFAIADPDTTEVDSIITNTVIYIQEDNYRWNTLQEILSQQTGVVLHQGDIHLRGGRAEDALYLIDGVDFTDLLFSTPYMPINFNALSKMWVELDGFDVRYGNTMSGVVNMSTRTGKDYYTGDLEYSTNGRFDEQRLNINLGGPFRINRDMTFFVSLNNFKTNDYSQSIIRKSNNDLESISGTGNLAWNPMNSLRITLRGDLLSQDFRLYDHSRSRGGWDEDFPLYKFRYSGLNLTLNHNINQSISYNIKAGYLKSTMNASSQNGSHYNDWKAIGVRLPWVSVARDSGWYDPETRRWSDGWSEEKAWIWYYEYVADYGYWDENTEKWYWTGRDTLEKLQHAIEALNQRYYEINEWMFTDDSLGIYYHEFDLEKFIEDIKRWCQDTTFTADSIEPSGNMHYIRYNSDEFGRFNYNFIPFWYEEENSNVFLDFFMNSRLGKYNKVRLGGSFKTYARNATNIQFINQTPYLDTYKGEPFLAAVYLSNRIDYKDFAVNAGLRLDYFDPRVDNVNPKHSLSPRITTAFSPTPSTTIYVNCGKFVQLSGLEYAYYNIDTNLYVNDIVGNPNISWEEAMMYAIGISSKAPYGLKLDASFYIKDMNKLLRCYELQTIWHNRLVSYMTFDVSDYATIYGADLSIGRNVSKYLDWLLSYSYLNTEGSGDQPSWYPPDIRKNKPLAWDITHSLALNMSLVLPVDFGPKLGTICPLSNLTTTFRFTYKSAFPYDSTDIRGKFINVERAYDYLRTDLRFSKDLLISGLNLGFYIEIWNLFNRRNIIDVHSYTGKPDDDGDPPEWDSVRYEAIYETDPYINRKYEGAYDVYLADYENWRDYCNNPDFYDIPRTLRFGVYANF